MSALAIMGIIIGTLVTIAIMPLICVLAFAAVWSLLEWLTQ